MDMTKEQLQLLQDLKNELIAARLQIRYFHQFTVRPSEATQAWKTFEELSPAMCRINEMIIRCATIIEYNNEKLYQNSINPSTTGLLD